MSGTTTDTALVAAATSTTPYATPTLPLNDPLLQLPTLMSDEMYAKVKGPEIADVTTKIVGGTGVFDTIMASLLAHLKAEYEKDRITGAEYTKAYIETAQMALNASIQFTLGKEQAFWVAQKAQIDAVAGRIDLERGRVALNKGQFDAMTAQYTLSQILPKQREALMVEISGKTLDNSIKTFNLAEMLPRQSNLLQREIDGKVLDNSTKTFNLNSIMPLQANGITLDNQGKSYTVTYLMPAQATLVKEQGEVQRAQTSDTRSDGAAVAGVAGGQKALYAQQIVSYQRDSQLKVAKLFADAWTIQKTVDEGLTPPGNFTNAEIDDVIGGVRNINNLG